jgi:hypothetical protein
MINNFWLCKQQILFCNHNASHKLGRNGTSQYRLEVSCKTRLDISWIMFDIIICILCCWCFSFALCITLNAALRYSKQKVVRYAKYVYFHKDG